MSVRHALASIGALRSSIRQFGGLRHVIRRAINLAHSEGFEGVLRGFAAIGNSARRYGGDGRNDYQKWVAQFDTMTALQRAQLARQASAFRLQPVVSIVMPVYNPEPRWLEAAIDSVRAQIYPHWELCIADDASTDPAIRLLLARYAESDTRIRVAYRERNGHISASSNTALAMAQGDWVALLDHDDLLAEHALFWIVDAINRHPDAALIYSDEDKITSSGVRCAPHFKPDWNYELFLAYNLVCHLGVYRKDVLSLVGGFQEGMEGAQDYDLALRCIEQIDGNKIVHVPRVLYHWRMHADSTAIGAASKPYALPAGERALNRHFQRCGIDAYAQLQAAGYYRTVFAEPRLFPRVSLIAISHGPVEGGELQDVDEIVRASDYPDKEVVIAGKNSAGDERLRAGRDAGLARVGSAALSASNSAVAVDAAVSRAKGEIVVLVDPALRPVSQDWLQHLVMQAIRPGVGAVGPRIVAPSGRVVGAGAIFGIHGLVGWAHRGLRSTDDGYFHRVVLRQALSAISPECVVVRKSLYEAAGGVATDVLSWPLAIADLCLRLKNLGCRNVYAGDVVMQKSAETDEARDKGWAEEPSAFSLEKLPVAIRERWLAAMRADPAYNPNLTLRHTDFSLAWPPRTETA